MKTFGAMLSLAAVGMAQPTKAHRPTVPQSSRTNVSAPLGLALSDEEVTSVPAHYRGMNAASLYSTLRLCVGEVKRSQYETKEQFDAEQANLLQLPLANNHKVGDRFTFVIGGAWDGTGSVPIDEFTANEYLEGAIQTSYEATNGILTVKIPTVGGVDGSSDLSAFGLTYRSRTTGHHMGQNAFGVKKSVSEGVSLNYVLQVQNSDLLWLKRKCDQHYGMDWECEFHIPADQARAMDGKIRVAISGTFVAPYIKEQSGQKTATLDSPYEEYEVSRGLYINPAQVVFFDSATGTVLAAYRATAGDGQMVQSTGNSSVTYARIDEGSAQTVKRIRVGSGEFSGRIRKKVEPIYPAAARIAHVSGTILIHVIISEQGEIQEAYVVSGPEILRQAAVDAVKQWQYAPWLENGQPKEVDTTIAVDFSFR